MYQDYKDRKWILAVILIAVSGLFLLGRFFLSEKTRNDVSEESAAAIVRAVEATALQCYVIEGAYPQSLEYLQENYGLTLNTEDFLVVYTPFAENLPPDVLVIDRNGS